ncbi:MAG: adenylate/guanylate cyclase domain-containing protein [Anaerolineales bacterium]|jgi:class 3 adenylate cyclase
MDLQTILGRPPQVLVADDDRNIRELLQTYLEGSGCRVFPAGNGKAAMEILERESIDLVLLDIEMPGGNGLEICRAIKEDKRTRMIPVMIVTGHESERLEAIDSGADEFLGKPLQSVILLTRARSLLRLRKLHLDLEERNELLRRTLHRYVSKEMADTILGEPERYLRLGGEIRRVTVLFADIKGFVRFTENHSAGEAVDVLNRVFPVLTEVIFANNGTFDKFIGDAVMAFFGAPVEQPDAARRAVETARRMQLAFAELLPSMNLASGEIALGIGLHTGEAIVGNIGSETVMDYTAVGDTVNIAKRLQEDSWPGQVLLSQATYEEAGEPAVHRLGDRRLSGRSGPVTIFSLELQP